MSAVIAIGAAAALIRFKANVMAVIAVCGLIGLALQFFVRP
jgi:chromate transporter